MTEPVKGEEARAEVHVYLTPGTDRADLAVALGRALKALRDDGKIERGFSVGTGSLPMPLRPVLVEACNRIAELLAAFGPWENQNQVVTEVTRECAYNVARTDLSEFYRRLGDDAEAEKVLEVFGELVLPAAEADRRRER